MSNGISNISFTLTNIKANTQEDAIKQAKDKKLGDFIIIKDETDNSYRIGDIDDGKYTAKDKELIISNIAQSIGVADATLSFIDDPEFEGDPPVDLNSFDNLTSNELISDSKNLKSKKTLNKPVEIPDYIQNLIDKPMYAKDGVAISSEDIRSVKTNIGLNLFAELKAPKFADHMPQNLFFGVEFNFGYSSEKNHIDYVMPLNIYQDIITDVKDLYVASEKFKASAEEELEKGNYNKAAEYLKKASLCLKGMDDKLSEVMKLGKAISSRIGKFNMPDTSIFVGYNMPINQPQFNNLPNGGAFFEFGIKIKLPWGDD